ncbi:MAG: RNA pyrophosphohydrolase [Gammaproteobacteria bacterium]|nr:RNA pyrophosphohydrolase [Gammaproteobacteria bacterium]
MNTMHDQMDEKPVLDSEGYRSSVGIVLVNDARQLFWAKRIGYEAWQFPQGGIQEKESILDALYRELEEEIGLSPQDVKVLNRTMGWLNYRFPEYLKRRNPTLNFTGQKQKWFLLQLLVGDEAIRLDKHAHPELDHWIWVSYWYPLRYVIPFKRAVYRRVLKEFLKTDFFRMAEKG